MLLALRVVVTIVYPEVRKQTQLPLPQPQLRVTENQEKGVVSHRPFVRDRFEGSFLCEGEDEAAFEGSHSFDDGGH